MVVLDWIVAAFWSVVGFMTAAEWQASGTLLTLAVAVAAAIYARGQVKEARRSREERARPYVAAFLELAGESTLDLVVKNFGATTARNVRLISHVPLEQVWGDEIEPLLVFDTLPVLVPGQEWRTLFDVGGQRMTAEHHTVYTVTVESSDSRDRPLDDEKFVLDWHPYANTQYTSQKTIDDIGKALEGINKTLKSWTEGLRGLSVVARDGHKRDAAWAAQRLAREAQRAKLRPGTTPGA